MAKMSVGQKVMRVMAFIFGLRNPQAAMTLRAHGLTPEELAVGWQLLQAMTRGRLDVRNGSQEPDPTVLAALDAFENKWFPIVSASLLTRFPAVHAALFTNLRQTEGLEVIISVGMLIERFDVIDSVQGGPAARALLVQRGFTDQVVAQAKALLKDVSTFTNRDELVIGITLEEEEARAAELWNWYLEWSRIARTTIRDRRALRALGFLAERGGVLVEVDDGEEPDPVAPLVATPPMDTPAPANVPATPRVEPGMPGSDPFDVNP